jgi:hypothetical protein
LGAVEGAASKCRSLPTLSFRPLPVRVDAMKPDGLLKDEGRMARLLALEKARRGADRLVFVGTANVAGVRWCPMKAVLTSVAQEPMFFAVYLHDRLLYARLLGLLGELPSTDEGLLDAGADIGMEDVERLLRRVPVRPAPATWERLVVTLPDGAAWLINPALPAPQRARCAARAAAAGVKVFDLESDPKLRGVLLEEALAERRRTIRWHFARGPYVVVGEPANSSPCERDASTMSAKVMVHLSL